MKKRLLSIFLAALMLTSSSVVAMAAKKPKEEAADGGKKNLFEHISGLDTADQVSLLSGYNGTVSFETGDKVSGRGSAKFDANSKINSGVNVAMNIYPGETYDISFDVKTNTAADSMQVHFFFDANASAYKTLKTIPGGASPTWQHHEFTWTWDGTCNLTGQFLEGKGRLQFRNGSGNSVHTMYLDNISIMPHGNVPDAQYPALKPASSKEEEKLPDFEGPASFGVYAPKTSGSRTFADVKGHWAEETINTLAINNYVDGIDESNYSPNTNLTRAQFVKMVTDILNLTPPAYTADYKDVNGDEWYAPYLQIATNLSLLDPALTFGGFFYPDRAITREEAASIATRFAVLKEAQKAENAITFSDEADISAWAKNAVKDAAAYGLINGYETGKYLPKNLITRAEAAQILYRIAEISTRFAIYVDAQTGNDKNDGSMKAPLKTVQAARDMVRKYNDHMQNDIYVYIKGEQKLEGGLKLGVEDSGSNGHTVVYTSWGDEKATLSTGRDFSGFSLHDAEKNIYKVYVGTGMTARQAWFNGTRGILARTISGLANDCQWNERPETYISSDRWLLDLSPEEVEEIEMWYLLNYIVVMARMERVEEAEDGRVITVPNQANWNTVKDRVIYWANQQHEFPAYLTNSYQFLSHPGEFYIDKREGFLYYIPRDGEDMESMVLTLPMGERIVEVRGDSEAEPVHNLKFDNLIFKENDWKLMYNAPILRTQQNMMTADTGLGNTLDIPAGLDVYYGWYVDVTNCDFTRLGTKGIFFHEGIKYCNIIGNEVYDVAINGINVGEPLVNALDPEPLKYTEGCNVSNNYVHDIGYDYGIAAAITMGYAKDMKFLHNTITNVPYTGLHIGWGHDSNRATGTYMTNYEIAYNFINETQNAETFDGGSIYTLGAQNKPYDKIQSTIHHNYTKNNRNAYTYLYLDQGTTSTHWYENVVDTRDVYAYEYSLLSSPESLMNKDMYYMMTYYSNITDNIVENNYSTTGVSRTSAPDNIYGDVFVYPDANWPEEAQKIVDEAGIAPEYEDNFNLSGPKYIVAKQKEYILSANESVQLQVEVHGLHNEKYPLSAGNVRFEISDPEALTIDENGVATSTGKPAQVWVMVYGEIDGVVTTKKLCINAGDQPDHVEIGLEQLNILSGYTATLPLKVVSMMGLDMGEPDEIEITSTDPSVATADSSTKTVSALKEGSVTLTITSKKDGRTFVTELPVKVIGGTSSEEAAKLPFEKMSMNPLSWTSGATATGNGLTVSGNPAYYSEINNKLIGFDMVISEGNGWPSLMLCAADKMQSGINSQTIYLIGFLPDFIEVQRFVKGNRTYLFGDDLSLTPLVGPGIPNYDKSLYSYNGEPISVVVGALEGENGGTRLILTVNGKNLLDYTDTDADAIPPTGCFGVYTQNEGTFKFLPYSGKTQ